MLSKPQIKAKPWGSEIWFAQTKQFAGKILHIKKGHRYSLQYHEKKRETQYLFQGKIRLTIGRDRANLQELIMQAGDKIDIEPGTIHRAEGLEDSLIFEVSTPELDDVVKLADDYGRSGKGNNETLDQNLASKLKNATKEQS